MATRFSTPTSKRKIQETISPDSLISSAPLPIRRRSSVPDLPSMAANTPDSTPPPAMLTNQGQTINLTQLIHATLTAPGFISGLVPSLASALAPAIGQQITAIMAPFTAQIQQLTKELTTVKQANVVLKGKVDTLEETVQKLETSLEDLEQYGRRTSLRFHGVPLMENEKQLTDNKVVEICAKIDVPISTDDINRSHIIGDIRNGKAQIICRLRSWKIKNQIYQSRLKLKHLQSEQFRVFITEDLTGVRQKIIKGLSKAKKDRKIHSFWTNDGRVFYRVEYESEKILVKRYDDIAHLIPEESPA